MRRLHLSEDQIVAIERVAGSLAPPDRWPFFERVAELLADREVGDGIVHRAVVAAFREFWRPPAMEYAPRQVRTK